MFETARMDEPVRGHVLNAGCLGHLVALDADEPSEHLDFDSGG